MVVITKEVGNKNVIIRKMFVIGAIDKAIVVFDRPTNRMATHLKLLCIKAHFDGVPISKVLVDNGALVNLLPS